ncbi:nicotinate-nucleotide--dimethylbenzimidazole phosphoribosyltransferase [Streptomyces sp. NPDC001606]
MTDTGQVPGEGQPESAGMVEQPGVPAHGAYTYLSEAPAEDEELLLPGAQGAWGNEVPPPAPEPVLEALHEPGPHETAGRDSGSVDLSGVRLPNPNPGPASVPSSPILSAPHDATAAAQPPRRPLHLGPPIPDASASPVRSLADRGPAGAPVRQPGPSQAGPEYLDVQPQSLHDMAPQSAAPWGAPLAAPAPAGEQPHATLAQADAQVPMAAVQADVQAPVAAVQADAQADVQAQPDAVAQTEAQPQVAAVAQTDAQAPAAETVDPAAVPAPEAAADPSGAAQAAVARLATQAVAQQPAPAQPEYGHDGVQPVPGQDAEYAVPAGQGPQDMQQPGAEAGLPAEGAVAMAGGPEAAQPADASGQETAVPQEQQAAPVQEAAPADAGAVQEAVAEAAVVPETVAQEAVVADAPGEVTPGPVAEEAPATDGAEVSAPAQPAADAQLADPAQAPVPAAEPVAAEPVPGTADAVAAEAVEVAAETVAVPAEAAVLPPEAVAVEAAPAQDAPAQLVPEAAVEQQAAAEPVAPEPVAVAAPVDVPAQVAPEVGAEQPVASEDVPQPDPAAVPVQPQDAPAAEAEPVAVAVPDAPAAAPAPEAGLAPEAEVLMVAPAVNAVPEQPVADGTAAAEPHQPQGPQLAAPVAPQPEPAAVAAEPLPASAPGAAPDGAAPAAQPEALPVEPAAEQPAPAAAEPQPEQPLAQSAPMAAQPAAPQPVPAQSQPSTPPAQDAQEQTGQPEPVATVPAPREAEPDAPAAEQAPVVVQQAEDLQTRGAEQEEGPADAAEAQRSTGPAAPPYDEVERAAVLKVMRERRDIRNGFRNDPIPHEVLLRVLEAAHTAPSVGHSQPWDFVVIRSADTRRTMHELAMRQREAYAKSLPKGRAKQFKELKIEAILDTPVNIVVTADPTRGGRHTLGRYTQPQMAPYSAALAVENLWLAARAEGLGVGWVSFFDEREMVRALGLPEHLEVIAYLCVGYVDEFPDEPELMQAGWSKRRPLSWVVHEETYGRRALPGEEPHDLLAETVAQIRPLDAKALGEAWERQKRMTKPAGALGMLEIISAQLSGLSRQCPPPIPEPAAVAIFAGDHGVHAQGVTPWPQEVTAQMVANFLGGGAVCNAFANQVGAEVCVVDVGVAADLPATPGLLPRKIRGGTSDMTTGPAMTREEAKAAIEVGIETARDLVAAGNRALLTGEMGIANTTASAALISVFTGADPAEVTGRGTGINDETLARKTEVVRRALDLHKPDPADPIGVLAALGGFEHAAMVGLLLGGASLRTPVILDGVSAGAAALVARAIAPEVLAACIAGHRSAEPGHVAALNKLGLRPLVDLDLRLGEGTGALLALPLVQSAARAMHEVATFDSAGVTEK